MRPLTLLLFLTIVYPAIGQTDNPFLKLKFDKVLFYDFEENGEKGSLIVDNNGKPSQFIVKQVQLDAPTIKQLSVKLGERSSYGNGAAACFEPHCGFVYFWKGKPVAQITVCVGCNRLHSNIDIPAKKQGKHGQGEEVYYALDGLSKSFRKYINGLLKKYSFSHQIKPGSGFDK